MGEDSVTLSGELLNWLLDGYDVWRMRPHHELPLLFSNGELFAAPALQCCIARAHLICSIHSLSTLTHRVNFLEEEDRCLKSQLFGRSSEKRPQEIAVE